MREKNTINTLPISIQVANWVLIACIYYLGIYAFGISLPSGLPYRVDEGTYLLSYGVLFVLVVILFIPHKYAPNRNKKSFGYILFFLVTAIIMARFFDEGIRGFYLTFDLESHFFSAIHWFMIFLTYAWIALFNSTYFSYKPPKMKLYFVLLSLVSPALSIGFYLLLIFTITHVLSNSGVRIYGWFVWVNVLFISVAIFMSANILILIADKLQQRLRILQVLIVIGLILNIIVIIMMNQNQALLSYLANLYFEFPDFIR